MQRLLPWFVVCCLFEVAVLPPRCQGQEFRVETDVFVDDQKDPVVETLTIFADGVVYDFLLTGVEEITLFDPPHNRLVLMDTERHIKTELSLDSILTFAAEMKSQLTDAQRDFLLGEKMATSTDADGWIKLSNDRVTYRAEGIEPKTREIAVEYHQFADWYARLNAMRRGNLPPFARIQLNAELAGKGLIPKTIERTIVHKQGLKQNRQVLRSQHLVNWRLSHTDRKLIDRAGTCVATYKTVPLREYIRLPDAGTEGDHHRP